VTINEGQITFDVAKLEAKLTARLINSNTQEEKIVAVSQTFTEVIERDKSFGSLLLKIKQAYTDFIKERERGEDVGQEQTIEQL
jgi:hypothetical protein